MYISTTFLSAIGALVIAWFICNTNNPKQLWVRRAQADPQPLKSSSSRARALRDLKFLHYKYKSSNFRGPSQKVEVEPGSSLSPFLELQLESQEKSLGSFQNFNAISITGPIASDKKRITLAYSDRRYTSMVQISLESPNLKINWCRQIGPESQYFYQAQKTWYLQESFLSLIMLMHAKSGLAFCKHHL